MFGTGNYATVWAVEDKGKYSVVELSTSVRDKNGEYVTDFSHKFVSFLGKAHEAAKNLSRKSRIKIGGCGVSNSYDKNKGREYVNFKVFDFEIVDGSKPSKKEKTKVETSVEDEDDDLPF